MKRMRRKHLTALLIALSTVLALTFMVNQAYADIQQWIWYDYVYRGYDNYYSSYIVAYLNGATAKLKLPIVNDRIYSINITAISLVFDTGYNVTITPAVNITSGEIYYFDLNFTADVNNLPNLWAHTYTIYAHFQHEFGVGSWTREWDDYSPPYRFVVCTSDQKDAKDLSTKYSAYSSSYPPYSFEIIGARLLATQAGVEASIAQNFANLGNFAEAKAHYQAAVNLYEQAFDVEEEKGTAMQDAEVNAMEKQADAAVKEADAAMLEAQAIMNQSYGYILFGLGFILIGVGAIIYAAKKPKIS
ncbi:MAG: hypothetical protein QW270_05425 [Candidatus Bathyarchaeia archaeon]